MRKSENGNNNDGVKIIGDMQERKMGMMTNIIAGLIIFVIAVIVVAVSACCKVSGDCTREEEAYKKGYAAGYTAGVNSLLEDDWR